MKKLHAILFLVTALLMPVLTGCKTQLEPGGGYAPTNSAGEVVYEDNGLFLADAAYRFAYETIGSVFKFERDNREEIWALTPKVKEELDKLRAKANEIDRRWAFARQAYRQNPTPAGLSTLQTILSEIQRLLPTVQSQLAPVYEKVAKPSN